MSGGSHRPTIRLARPSDAEALAGMRVQLQRHLKDRNPAVWDLSEQRVAELPAFYRETIADPTACVVVAVDHEDLPVGLAMGSVVEHPNMVPARSGKIDDVWVAPEHRRRGTCRAMLARLMGFFGSAGVAELHLNFVGGNVEAEAVWRGLGFESVVVTAVARREAVEGRLGQQGRG